MFAPLIDLAIWAAVIVVGGLLAILLFIAIGVACSGLPGLGLGSVMLDCPHCGRSTPSTLPECRHCGKSFRDDSGRPQPVIDAPKLRE